MGFLGLILFNLVSGILSRSIHDKEENSDLKTYEFNRYSSEKYNSVYIISQTPELSCLCNGTSGHDLRTEPVYYWRYLNLENNITLTKGARNKTVCGGDLRFHPRRDVNREFSFLVRCYTYVSVVDSFDAVEITFTVKETFPWSEDDGHFTFNNSVGSISPCTNPGTCPTGEVIYNIVPRHCCAPGVPRPPPAMASSSGKPEPGIKWLRFPLFLMWKA